MIVGSNHADALNASAAQTTLHGLGGHQRHIDYLASIPIANVLVKGICAMKHPTHISYLANIPMTNVLVERACVGMLVM
jgi:hypothetical protein